MADTIDLLMTIPGLGEKASKVVIAETFPDPSAEHRSEWADVAPATSSYFPEAA